jgi:hypothetical protein
MQIHIYILNSRLGYRRSICRITDEGSSLVHVFIGGLIKISKIKTERYILIASKTYSRISVMVCMKILLILST